jgi:HTH-type transcriptional regulator, sugar sensing transcriptional regulator
LEGGLTKAGELCEKRGIKKSNIMNEQQLNSLKDIGFSNLEAIIYLELLTHEGSTGYSLAKKLNKSRSNVYHALESLVSKGAIVGNMTSGTRNFNALPLDSYLKKLQHDLDAKKIRAKELLKDIKPAEYNYGLYPLSNMEQVYEKSLELINNSEDRILIAVKTLLDERVRVALERAIARGVNVLIESYPPAFSVAGADYAVFKASIDPKTIFFNWLEIMVDTDKYIFSLFNDKDQSLFKAIWCTDPYVSLTTHNANVCSFMLTKSRQMLVDDLPKEEIIEVLNSYFKRYYQGINHKIIDRILEKPEISSEVINISSDS